MTGSEKSKKIAVMGYQNVGKSSLCVQLVDGVFLTTYDPTIENTFHTSFKVQENEYDLELVDTAGQDEYSGFPEQYSMNIHGYILVYSITNEKSYDIVKDLYRKLLDMKGQVSVPVVLVGNKTDLSIERVISTDEGKKLADEWKAVFVETTAKKRENVNEVFKRTVMEIERSETIRGKSGNDKCVIS